MSGLRTMPARSGRALALALLVAAGCAQVPPHRAVATLRIYLARHGQTDWNAARRLQGGIDIPLNATGRRQAAWLAERLKGVRLDRVYSSTLSRSRETAEIARGSTPLVSLAGLDERRMGRFEGVRLDTSDTATIAEFERRNRDPADALDGGESLDHFFARVREAVEAMRRRHRSGAFLIVGHGGTNQMILRALLNLTPTQADSIHQANDELYLVEIDPGVPPRLWKSIPTERLRDL